MSKENLYLKHRPFNLSDVVGQKHVVETLKQAALSNKFVHSYLFGGEKGTGKTSIARILATLVNCTNLDGATLCGKCSACTKIHDGYCTDIFELDGGKNRSVEDVDKMLEFAQWAPQELKKKVYIIDEAHLLSTTAISSLLKIVEEPPEHLMFIFCTTDVKKLPVTILSRSQKHWFRKIKSNDIAARLGVIAKAENINVQEQPLTSMAKLSRGSMRDAIGYLEQIATIANSREITEDSCNKYFGVVDRKGVYAIVNSILTANYSLLLDQINDLIVLSSELSTILFEISDVFRNIMIVKVQGDKSKLLELPDNEIEQLKKMSETMDLAKLDKLSKIFGDINSEQTFGINERWIMESILIRCAALIKKV